MSTLDIIIGPMFAGKSCELIRRIRQLKVLEKEFLVIKPNLDNRYSNNEIVSHNYDKEHCICYENICDIFNDYKIEQLKKLNTIFIDEGQFFNDLKVGVLKLLEEYNINIVITGLDGDSNRNRFGEILDLIPYSNTCTKINALCQICKDGTEGIFSYRIVSTSNDQVLIGAKDKYMAVCRKHYHSSNRN